MAGLMFTLLTGSASGQSKPILVPYVIENGDTIPVCYGFEIPVVVHLDDDALQRRKYWERLRRNVALLMPYAKTANMKMEDINRTMEGIKSSREKKRYLKAEEKKLKEDFEARLKDLSTDQGKILIKLIDRETGRSSFSLIKEYKSGFSAFVWNGLASVCGMDLKDKYDPVDKDASIEWTVKSLGYN